LSLSVKCGGVLTHVTAGPVNDNALPPVWGGKWMRAWKQETAAFWTKTSRRKLAL